MANRAPLNDLALKLKQAHIPGNPLLLANVYDAPTARIVASSSSTKALATASFAIAATQGIEDDDMTLAQNQAGIRNVIAGMKKADKWGDIPLTADLQDCYDDPAQTIKEAIELGVVGCNMEDYDGKKRVMRSKDEAVARLKAAVKSAQENGVPDFVINARTDVLGFDGTIDDVIGRGKAFLDAGATTLFVWGVGKYDITEEDVKKMTEALDGRLAVQPGILSIPILKKCGVARISVGPMLFREAMKVYEQGAAKILGA